MGSRRIPSAFTVKGTTEGGGVRPPWDPVVVYIGLVAFLWISVFKPRGISEAVIG